MSGFFSAPRRFVTENTGPDAKGYWYAPRRYSARLEKLKERANLRILSKSEQLNYMIKRLVVLTLRKNTIPTEGTTPVVSVYSVEDYILYTDSGDTVSSTTLQINSTGVRKAGTKLKLP